MGRCLSCLLVIVVILAIAAPPPAGAAVRKILVIGDSQSEEYAFEAGPSPLFSGPDSDLLRANIRNWMEILAAERPGDLSFGNYDPRLAAYSDIRNGGYAYNWSVPGAETGDFVELIDSTLFSNWFYFLSKNQMIDQIEDVVGYVVIFLGANDVRSVYGDFYNNTVSSGFNATLVANLKRGVDFVQSINPGVRIVVVNIPDPGITPSKIAAHPNAAKRAAASGRIAALNQSIAAMASSEGCALADVMALTDQLRTPGDFLLNGRAFLKEGHPENPPGYVFAKDGFHPSTVAQALYANAIVHAINTKWNQGIPPLAHREILGDVLGLHPDQPLLDWLAASGAGGGTGGNADGDGLPNLAEFGLSLDPARPDVPRVELSRATRGGMPVLLVSFPEANTRNGYLVLRPQESGSAAGPWTDVPVSRQTWLPGGGLECWDGLSPEQKFFRLAIGGAP